MVREITLQVLNSGNVIQQVGVDLFLSQVFCSSAWGEILSIKIKKSRRDGGEITKVLKVCSKKYWGINQKLQTMFLSQSNQSTTLNKMTCQEQPLP